MAEILDALAKPHIKGLSLLGGDELKMQDSIEKVASKYLKNKEITNETLVKLNRFLYSRGYEFDQIKSSPLIRYCDVAVTGKFILEQRDISDNNR